MAVFFVLGPAHAESPSRTANGGATSAPAELEPRPESVVVVHDPPSDVPVYGHRYAPVTVDFFCSLADQYYARNVYALLMELAKRHPHRLRIAYRLVDPIGRSFVAEAALEAFAQGRFHEFIAEVLSPTSRRRILKPSDLAEPAKAAGLDQSRLALALADGRHVAAIEAADRYKRRRRITTRLALLFNGKEPARPARRMQLDDLEEAYDEAYSRAEDLLDRGVPLSRLYQRALIELDASMPPVAIPHGMVDNPPKGTRPSSKLYTRKIVRGLTSEVDAHARGAESPEVVLVFFCSFQSRYCARANNAVEKVLDTYPDELRVVFRDMFDETDPRQPDVRLLHEASRCAEESGVYWEFFDHAFRNLQGRRRARSLSEPDFRAMAESIDINADAFMSCIAERRHEGDVERALRKSKAAGITHTPSIVIGDRLYVGVLGEKHLRELVEEELRPGLLEILAPSYLTTKQ